MDEEEIMAFIRGNNNFTQIIHNHITSNEENIFTSPFSLHSLLTLISQDPGIHYNAVFTNLLCNFCKQDMLRECYKTILALINSGDNKTFSTSNKIFLRNNYHLQDVFKDILINNFSYEIQLLDLSRCDSASESINAWVENKTNRKIKDLINSGSLDDATRLVLLNVMNLVDKWALPFNVEDTIPATFYLNNNDSLEVQMMRSKMEVYYKNDTSINAKILELPFNNNDLNLVIILPNQQATIETLLDKLQYWNVGDIDFTGNIKQEIDIRLPKFRINCGIDLTKILHNQLGLSEIFSEKGKLFGMIENEEFLCFDKIQQMGFIDVNEEGTEASVGTICTSVPSKIDDLENISKNGLVMHEMSIKSNVCNRFAKNLVISTIRNTEITPQETVFTINLPDTAFITEFFMEIDGKTYKSYIKGKQEAKNIYNEALASGRSAGIVEASVRDSNLFLISVNLQPQSVAVFSLTYEEMFQCVHDQYELVLNIHPGQIVENLNVEVTINESRPLKFVKTPPLRSGNEMNKNEKYLQPSTDIEILNPKSALVKFSLTPKQQAKIANYLGTVKDGFSGQFVVQYSVERDPHGGEILLQDGYFVHFFAPNDLDPLLKHVVFVLDTSTSMAGRKIAQLKDAMMSILSDIRKQDIISIIEFNSEITIWDINTEQSTTFFYEDYIQHPFSSVSEYALPDPAYASDVTINKAKNVIQKINSDGGTFMIGGLQTALYLVKIAQQKHVNTIEKYQPVMVFLTDGEPNVGISSTEKIVEIVTRLNFDNNKVPIFSLSFGDGADKHFLRKLSLRNLGFSRHIYEASDASLQLQAFYKQISSPLLSDIKFKYESEVKDVTKSNFPIYFEGSELIVSGRYKGLDFPASINCCGQKGSVILKSVFDKPVSSLERLWAYLTVKQLLEERNFVEEKTELTKKATDIALKYSFVTEVTSLVVVKPNETDPVNIEKTEENFAEDIVTRNTVCKKRLIKKRKGYIEENMEIVCVEEEPEHPEKKITTEEFLADHPFLIIIKYKKDNKNVVLFIGQVLKPLY